jgi:hypothetical protein
VRSVTGCLLQNISTWRSVLTSKGRISNKEFFNTKKRDLYTVLKRWTSSTQCSVTEEIPQMHRFEMLKTRR